MSESDLFVRNTTNRRTFSMPMGRFVVRAQMGLSTWWHIKFSCCIFCLRSWLWGNLVQRYHRWRISLLHWHRKSTSTKRCAWKQNPCRFLSSFTSRNSELVSILDLGIVDPFRLYWSVFLADLRGRIAILNGIKGSKFIEIFVPCAQAILVDGFRRSWTVVQLWNNDFYFLIALMMSPRLVISRLWGFAVCRWSIDFNLLTSSDQANAPT